MLMPGFLDEPVIIVRKQPGKIHAMSNVCTHRGNLLVNSPGNQRVLHCGYHGRCFGLDGTCRSMPAFEEVPDFPSVHDDLKNFQVSSLGPMLFVQLGESGYLTPVIQDIRQRMVGYDFDGLTAMPALNQEFEIEAHWALYVDNYLEGFHVPFVHPGLNASLDMEAYAYETHAFHNLQLGFGKDGDELIVPDGSSPKQGKHVIAYYWWIWPNIMLNCYSWGVSLNIVNPIGPKRTLIQFETFLFDPADQGRFLQSGIVQTEIEDEEIVLQVQKGIQSSAYDRGRYSPVHEKCVHHFHQLIARAMNEGPERETDLNFV